MSPLIPLILSININIYMTLYNIFSTLRITNMHIFALYFTLARVIFFLRYDQRSDAQSYISTLTRLQLIKIRGKMRAQLTAAEELGAYGSPTCWALARGHGHREVIHQRAKDHRGVHTIDLARGIDHRSSSFISPETICHLL